MLRARILVPMPKADSKLHKKVDKGVKKGVGKVDSKTKVKQSKSDVAPKPVSSSEILKNAVGEHFHIPLSFQ